MTSPPQIWDVDLQKNEMVVRDVLLVAQGEMALEEFMKQIREQWQTYELELVNYQNKCKLIKGWDELFTKLKENINSLTAMKLSPYFKVSWQSSLCSHHYVYYCKVLLIRTTAPNEKKSGSCFVFQCAHLRNHQCLGKLVQIFRR